MTKTEKLDPKRVLSNDQVVRESTLRRWEDEALAHRKRNRWDLTGYARALYRRRQRHARRVRAAQEELES